MSYVIRRKQAASKDKKSWSAQEDANLLNYVAEYGTTSWSRVADSIRTRTGKQCRERYHNHLDPNVKKGGWSKEEDALILSLQKQYGNAWAKITSYLPGRTDNAVKNRYWSATRSAARKMKTTMNRQMAASDSAPPGNPKTPHDEEISECFLRGFSGASVVSHTSASESEEEDEESSSSEGEEEESGDEEESFEGLRSEASEVLDMTDFFFNYKEEPFTSFYDENVIIPPLY
ncbi:hypothetical protein TrRE_jg12416 [Triparma retinervis]|uniref:Uncharacterized protein n=1 Tax=Triparma retinervis TaxID=2557542 RepID=A0A9W6Z6Y7_9STRA|nr:hypothetical protein TrRE_jg12416 [Triparma retinervis]